MLATRIMRRIPVLRNLVPVSGSGAICDSYYGNSPTYGPTNAYDRSLGGANTWNSTATAFPHWIGYDFGVSTIVLGYTVDETGGSTTYMPKDFQFQGWDGSTWVVLDSHTGYTGTNWATKQTFTIANPGGYTKYRLYIIATIGSSTSGEAVIRELEMLGY